MRFTTTRFLAAIAVSIFLGFVAVALLRALGVLPSSDPGDPAVLAQQAEAALDAVRNRQPGERRPASYDAVLAPLDALLVQTKTLLESETYNPAADYEKIRALALPVIGVATRADAQARAETGYLTKEYRFNDQKGEASQYLANALWERILRTLPKEANPFGESPRYPPGEMRELRRILDEGIAAAPDNAKLLSIRGVVNRAEGQFGPAARDLEAAVAVDAEDSAAWNTLGLVRISLKEFDKAAEALERARSIEEEVAKRNGAEPGAEYTAILYNLASFHEGLASFYNREYRVAPTVESQRLMRSHAEEAQRYYEEFLRHEPSDSPDAASARARLQTLPR